MNKKTTSTGLTVLLLLAVITSFAQGEINKYSIVTLKGNLVSGILNTYPEFSYFDFTFVQLEDNIYSLEGYAKDKDQNQLGSLITLIPMTNQPARRFKNLEKGHLYLDLLTMQEHNVDGSEDYILTPRKCKNRAGNYVDYVSYRFSNKIEPSFGFIEAKSVTAVKSFNLNPSPPY
ncbi:hypothetical protein [Segetibacter koreensis]|uniref:hypothetical protein n=1 Tax=Segetibacter koreensis TaxID=398037 RepID=UPI0003815EE9|nr:hypothetical protein [Segetibacter koreensis]